MRCERPCKRCGHSSDWHSFKDGVNGGSTDVTSPEALFSCNGPHFGGCDQHAIWPISADIMVGGSPAVTDEPPDGNSSRTPDHSLQGAVAVPQRNPCPDFTDVAPGAASA